MTEQDVLFFEQYKRLDKLCGDMYQNNEEQKSGVTLYIEDMEAHFLTHTEYYKKLKHIRWVRNSIAHDTLGKAYSEPQDLDTVTTFHKMLLSGSDPLSKLRKPKAKANIYNKDSQSHTYREHTHREEGDNSTIAIIIMGLIAAAVLIIFLLSRYKLI